MPASARFQDHNGFLFVKGCPIASSGVFQYSAAQVGLPGDPNRIVNVYRPPESVSDVEYIASLQLIPLINDHEMLSGFQGDTSATAPEDYGVDGILADVGYGAPWVHGDIKIFARSMQADLSSGKKDLSLGYTCDFEIRSIVVDGVECEVIQTNMRGNHIALVEVGRVPGARILDGKRMCFDALSFSTQTNFDQRGFAMAKPNVPRRAFDSNAAATVQALMKQLLPAFEQFMGEEAAEPQHQGAAPAAAQPAAQAADPTATAADPNAGAQAAGEAASAATAVPAAGGETGTGEVASAGASSGGEAGAAQPASAATGGAVEQGEGETDGTGDPKAIIGQMIKLMQELGACLGGEEPAASAAQPEGDMGGEASGGEGAESNAGEANGESTEDAIEGLEAEVREGADEGSSASEGGQGTASEGPAAGKHAGLDAALRNFYADAARKTGFVDRLSKVVGAFDGALDLARCTAFDVAAYGVKALKIKCPKGHEMTALDAHLSALESVRGASPANPVSTQAADSAESDSVVSAYLKKVS
jgi:hypothetical protein